ncbi:MAG: DUF3224 domain-containing protein [Aeromicrobium sp.]
MSPTHTITARFTVASWDETVVVDIEGGDASPPERGFSRADVSYAYSGPIEGTSIVSYLISYRPGVAPVAGFERFEGSIDGHDGSLVFQHEGEHDADGVRATLTIVDGLGTGGLETMTGEATIDLSGHGSAEDGYEISLRYDL